MNARSLLCLVFLMTGVILLASPARAGRQALLHVSEGHVPTDTGSDGKTTFAIAPHKELGGPALKIQFAVGDSAGDRVAKVTDWTKFITLVFAAFNPSQGQVKLSLTVKHGRTTSYQTRVDVPIVLKPGASAVRIGVDEMRNVNGSAPDLANVVRWYLACEAGQSPTVYIGDIWLVGPDAPDAPAAPARGVGGAAPAYRITGKVGDKDVDLTARPIAAGGAAVPRKPAGDPARLKRIRAAKMPTITKPVPFNTPQADAIATALEVFPPDNPWNQLVTDWPLHPDSKRMIASIGADKPLRYNDDMSFIFVPPSQKRVPVKIVSYPGESDKGPFPVPDDVPIEGWPSNFRRGGKGSLSLEDVQRDKLNRGGDRHAIVVDPINRMLYEFYIMRRTDAGWQAAQASVFDLKTNKLRPVGWTSADAAGLPIFPSVVRYDEMQRGRIDHALRVTIRKTRRAFVAPATHFASKHTNAEYPRMGERIRLRQDFDVSPFTPPVRTILTALKRYGMLVADNGIEWAVSVAPDERIPVLHAELRKVKGADFEVVVAPK